MSHPDDEDLVDLALGDSRSLSAQAQLHVADCSQCSATVESIRRTTMLVARSEETTPWQSPPASVWESIEADVIDDSADLAPAPASAAGPLAPDLSLPRSSQGSSGSPDRVTDLPVRSARGRASITAWIAGGVAAGLAVGLLAGRAVWSDEPAPTTPSTTTIASATLDTLDTRQQLGNAALQDDAEGVQLVVDTEPLDAGDGYLEVWLINSDLKRMVSVGVYRGSGSETFPVSRRLIDEGYVIVDVSQEALDNHPEHSGDSLLRGVLKA